jgi:DNA-binding CsgD family transcriptional regulator
MKKDLAMDIDIEVDRAKSELTNKQNDLLAMLPTGLTLPEIAEACHRTLSTINTHHHALLAKLDAKNRAHAISIAVAKGYLKISPKVLCLCLAFISAQAAVFPTPSFADSPMTRTRTRGGSSLRLSSGASRLRQSSKRYALSEVDPSFYLEVASEK